MGSDITWEIFNDMSYFDMWCVRPEGDKDFNSLRSFHFALKQDADDFKALVEKAKVSLPSEPCKQVCKTEHIGTAGSLRKALEEVPDDRMVLCKTKAVDGTVWSMRGELCTKINKEGTACITFTHEDLKTLSYRDILQDVRDIVKAWLDSPEKLSFKENAILYSFLNLQDGGK